MKADEEPERRILLPDEPADKFDAFQSLRQSDAHAADAALMDLGAKSPVDRDIVLELSAPRPLGHPEKFESAHRPAVRGFEVLDRNGSRGIKIRGLRPLSPVAARPAQQMTTFIVRSHVSGAATKITRLDGRREADCELDDPALPMLRRARIQMDRLLPGFKRNVLGTPLFVIGGALFSTLLTLVQRALASAFASLWSRVVATMVIGLLMAGVAWVIIRGAAVARRRIKLSLDGPARALRETIGSCGKPSGPGTGLRADRDHPGVAPLAADTHRPGGVLGDRNALSAAGAGRRGPDRIGTLTTVGMGRTEMSKARLAAVAAALAMVAIGAVPAAGTAGPDGAGTGVVAEARPPVESVWEHLNFQLGDHRFTKNPDSLVEHLLFRRAVAHAVDRKTLSTRLGGGAAPLQGFLDLYQPGLSTDPWSAYTYNPGRSARLVKRLCRVLARDCGADPPVVVFTTTSGNDTRLRMARLLRRMFGVGPGKPGIVLEVSLEDSTLFFGDTYEFGNWELGEWAWLASYQPANLPLNLAAAGEFMLYFDPAGPPPAGRNAYRFGTPAVAGEPVAGYNQGRSSVINDDTRRMARILRAIPTDSAKPASPTKRQIGLLREAEQILARQLVIIPLYVRP